MKKSHNHVMIPKFIRISVVEGFSIVIEKILNVDHIIQFESNRGRAGHCHLYLTDGKVLCVVGTLEDIIYKLNNN